MNTTEEGTKLTSCWSEMRELVEVPEGVGDGGTRIAPQVTRSAQKIR